MAKTKVTKATKGGMLNYLYGLRCDTNWSIKAAMDDNGSDDYIQSMKDESKTIDALVNLVKESDID